MVHNINSFNTSLLMLSVFILISGGVTSTVKTDKLSNVVLGTAAIGGGLSLISNPLMKTMSGERVTAEDLAIDLLAGATISVATERIVAGGSALAKDGTCATKIAVTLGFQSIAGASGGVIAETANVFQGGEVSVVSYLKAVAIGAVSGFAGGAFSKLKLRIKRGFSLRRNKAANGFVDAAWRVAVQVVSASMCATAVEAFTVGGWGKTDADSWKKVRMNVATQAVVAGLCECPWNAVQVRKAKRQKKP